MPLSVITYNHSLPLPQVQSASTGDASFKGQLELVQTTHTMQHAKTQQPQAVSTDVNALPSTLLSPAVMPSALQLAPAPLLPTYALSQLLKQTLFELTKPPRSGACATTGAEAFAIEVDPRCILWCTLMQLHRTRPLAKLRRKRMAKAPTEWEKAQQALKDVLSELPLS